MAWKKILLEGDALALGDFMFKQPVRVASTANIDLATGGLLTIDGVTLVAGDRVLVKNQTTASQNGIYAAAAGAWSRTTDADASAEVKAGLVVMVEEGTVGADTQWQLTTNNPITLDTTILVFGKVGPGANLSDTAPVDVDFLTAAAGTATEASRQDHKHDVAEALVGDLVAPSFAGAGVGTANKFVRADHKHALTEGTLTDLQPVDGTAESLGTVDKLVRADHIHALGPLVADLNFSKKQAKGMALDVQTTAPSTPVDGQIYFNTTAGDKHPYVYVA